ncbi:TonB-dependent receptor [Polluticoccus soli]|uniref:TonB-dependent receptor n=1 Tax=Polluticoccus soli TaxID=3034150 RepID=UPI0023E2AE31|nr:carboxypeptidase regulatory-like domain-containing protein [Flavipsychrobacter sp. JY13-12]
MTRKLRYLFALLFVSVAGTAFAQSGAITGTVVDETKAPMIGAIVQVLEGDLVKGGGSTDEEGQYLVKPLAPGRYTVKVTYQSYKTSLTSNVIVGADKNTLVNVAMELDANKLNEVVVVQYKIPLIDPFGDGRQSKSSEEIEKMATRSTEGIASTVGGVYQRTDGLSIGGARTDGTLVIIDGVQVRGRSGINLPQGSIDQMDVITSGLSAKYGDAIGGVINITTKGISNKLRGGVLLERGVDGYGHNLGNFTLSGPLYSKKIEGGKKNVAGFFIGADVVYDKDPRPVYGGTYKVNDAKLAELQATPLRVVPSQTGSSALAYSTEFVRKEDLELQKARDNANRLRGVLNGKLDFQLADNLNLTAGGNYSYSRAKAYADEMGYYSWSLFAADAIPIDKNTTARGYLRLTQRFGKANASIDTAEKKPLISNAYYTLQADYQTTNNSREHEDHKRDLFKYGYVGKFNTEYTSVYRPGQVDDTTGLTGVIFDGSRSATRTTFERSELNPILANYTSTYYNLSQTPRDIQEIYAERGLPNGTLPAGTYNLWQNVGASLQGYSFSQQDQFSVQVDASFDLQPGKTRHAIEFGLYYQQRIERSYSTGGASQSGGLWQYMRQLTNTHIRLDKENPVLIVGGKRYTKDDYRNGLVSFSPFDTIFYNYISVDTAQSVFDRNLRTRLGLDPKGTDFVNIDAVDPSSLSLDLFSADELFNQGNNFVSYYGYDYTGKKQKGQVNFNDFFTKKDANGNLTRDVAPYRPNYLAGYILDRFQYKDMLFNVGVRVDRFDNNTKVLKDPYSLYEVRKLGDVRDIARNDAAGGHPSNIGDDYVVYVNSNESTNPTVVGYRNGDNWYDPFGRQIDDPNTLKTYTGGRDPQPFLVNKTTRITDSTFDPNSSFTDYKPQVNVMPRVKFSFPISDVALFYAHYDVVVQRPRFAAYARPDQYYFMQNSGNLIMPNSDLKPEKLFDYEVGFQQSVTKQSSISLSAFYKERKDMIQLRPYLFAFPQTYYTYGNRDFSTTKGLRAVYDLRRVGNLRMNLSYTLQFAEGSGSGTSSGNGAGGSSFVGQNGLLQNLISAQLPNLRFATALDYDSRHQIIANIDYRFFDNMGPVVGNRHILQNAGANLIFSTRSGEPYTKYARTTALDRTILGSINGSRLPWHYMLDLRVDKDFKLDFGKKTAEGIAKKEPLIVNAYVMIMNVLNTRDVLSVNGYTGRTDDDGFLADPSGIALTKNQIDPQSYIDLYSISTGLSGTQNSINNINLPRRVNVGLQFNF